MQCTHFWLNLVKQWTVASISIGWEHSHEEHNMPRGTFSGLFIKWGVFLGAGDLEFFGFDGGLKYFLLGLSLNHGTM